MGRSQVLAFIFGLSTSLGAGQVRAEVARPLTLSEAVNRSLDSSRRIRQASYDHQAQVEKVRGAWADMGPRLKAEYNEVHFPSALTFQINPAAPPITARPDVTKVGTLTLAQPITGLAVFFEKARAEGAQRDIKDLTLKLTKSEVSYQTAEKWLEAYQLSRQLGIALASVSAAENQLKDAKALERVGRLSHGDVLRLELAVSEAKARTAQAKVAFELSKAALRDVLGMEPSEPLELDDALPKIPDQDPDLDTALKMAMDKRLETQRARHGVELAGMGKHLAYAQFSPNINLFTSINRNFADQLALGTERQFRTYGVQVSWDIWNNGSHIFGVREAAEQQAKAEEMVKSIEDGVKLDVQAAHANVIAAREFLALAKVAVEQASEAYRIETVRFRTGTRSATDLIMAETSEAGAKGRLVAAQTALINWHFKLEKALGGEQPQIIQETVR